MNKNYSLFLLAFLCAVLSGFGQYSGTGTFTKITSLSDLTDGYYIILNESNEFLMTNGRSGSDESGYFTMTTVTPVSGSITDPSTSNVWRIETNGSGRTIYNEDITKYVGWYSGNGASIEDTPANSNRWIFTYNSSKFTVLNVAATSRQLSYNAIAPRFAAYGNSVQNELQLYKLSVPTGPTITASPITLSNLDYNLGSGPSAEQSFDIEGSLLTDDITIAQPSNFEISTGTGAAFNANVTNPIILTPSGGDVTSTPIYVRLKSGLAAATYNETITATSTDATDVEIDLEGTVTPPAPANDYCSGAISLTPTGACSPTSYTNVNATDSGVTDPSCSSYGGADVWFSIVVPASGEITVETSENGGLTDTAMALYAGNCGSLSEIECDDDGGEGYMSLINATGLASGTTVYVRVFDYQGDDFGTFGICVSTPTPCAAPTNQPSNLVINTITSSSIDGAFTATTADEYVVVVSTSATLSGNPINGTTYSIGDPLGGGTVIQSSNATTFTATGLTQTTTYYFFVFAVNDDSCVNGPAYNSTAPLTGTETTISGPCHTEDFANIGTIDAYSSGTWTGEGGTWTVTDARGDQTINGKAITIRNGSLTSPSFTDGIGDLTVTTGLKFSGSSGTFDVMINGSFVGTIPYSATTQTSTISGINISGNINIVFNNNTLNTNRVAIDDLNWTCYSAVPGPEIKISGDSVEIADGDITPAIIDDTDFGNVAVAGGTQANTFTIYNTGTADLNISSISSSNSAEFAVSGTTSGLISASNSETFIVTFDPSAIGLRTSIITVANDDADEAPYTFKVSGNGTNSNLSTIVDNTNYSTTTPEFNSNPQYINFIDGTATAAGKFIPMKLKLLDGPDADGFDTKLTAISFSVEDLSNTNQLAMIKTALLTTTGGTPLGTATKIGNELVFSGLNSASLTATDDDAGGQLFHLRVSIDETQVIDKTKLVFKVTSATADASGSSFATPNAGGAQTDNANNNRNRLNVTADRLTFTTQPATTSVNTNLNTFNISATDLFANIDLDKSLSINLTTSGVGMTASSPYSLSNGVLAISNVQFNSAQTNINLTATTTGLAFSNTTTSINFDISDIAIGTYRTLSSGTWHSTSGSGTATWEQFSGGSYTPSSAPSTSTSNPVIIRHDIMLVGTNTASNLTIENNGILRTSTVSATFTNVLVKNGGIFKKEANGIKINGILEVENGGTVTFKHTNGTSRTTGFWKGTERFHEDSNFIIETTDNVGDFLVIETNGEVSEYDGGCFGNMIIDISVGKLQLLPSGFNKTLCKGDLIFRNHTENLKISEGNYSTTIKGDVIVESTFNRNITFLQSNGTCTINVEGDLLHQGPQDLRLANSQGANTPSVTFNIDGNIILMGGTLKFDIGSSSAGTLTVINLKGDISVNNSGLISCDNGNQLGHLHFNGIGDGLSDATTQTIDIASTNTTEENKKISFNIENGAYVKLINRNFELGNDSDLVVKSEGTFDFGFSGTTALNISISGTQSGTKFSSQQGSILKISSPQGITTIANVGNVQTVPSNRNFNQTATFHYIGKENQVTGNALTIGSAERLVFVNLIDNSKTLSLTNDIGIADETNLDANGGKLEIQQGTVIGTNTGDFYGSGRLVMTDGEYRINTITAAPLGDYLPRLGSTVGNASIGGYANYSLTGGVVHLNGNNANQILSGVPSYYNLKFSGSNSFPNYKGISTGTSVSETITISENAIVDIKNFNLGGPGTNLVMENNSRFIMAGSSQTKPDATGNYTLAPNTTLEFNNNGGFESIRLTNPVPSYANIVVSGNNVGTTSNGSGPNSFIQFQANGSFTVTGTGIFKQSNSNGFSGLANTSISNVNNPNIILDLGSTVEYAGASQTLTEFLPYYSNLDISGTGTKEMGSNAGIKIGENLDVKSSELYIGNNKYVSVENNATVRGASGAEGSILVATKGAFVQVAIGGTFNLVGEGMAIARKETPLKNHWYNYTYWSSPITNANIDALFFSAPANRRFKYEAANYYDQYMETMNDNGTVSGQDDIDDNGDDWQVTSGIMIPGTGYAVTGPQSPPGPIYNESVEFSGPFNTSTISTTIAENGFAPDNDWNFIGNPYPCAIDFAQFHSLNAAKIEGVAFLWSQATAPSATNNGNNGINFSQDDYALISVGSGNVAGASTIIPESFIPSGQGFFVVGTSNGLVNFTNSMRIADASSNNQFFRASESTEEPNKIWVNLTTDNGIFNQALIAYVDGATNSFDSYAYDAPRNLSSGTAAIIYTKIPEIDNKKFAIQGKAPSSLTLDEVIPLGFYTAIDVPTLYTLSIAQLEGDFMNNTTIYLKDNFLNTIHNLSTSAYSFTSETGEFNARFEILFMEETLATVRQDIDTKELSIIELSDGRVRFSVGHDLTIQHIEILDQLGRRLYQLKGNSGIQIHELSKLSQATYLAQVTLSNGQVITKKAIKRY